MLLVLIGPYFNHSHWSVSSLTEHILPAISLSLRFTLSCCTCSPTHPLTQTLSLDTYTSADMDAPANILPGSACPPYSPRHFIWPHVHSSSHSFRQWLMSPHFPQLPRSPPFFSPHISVSCTSFILHFLPSLISSLSQSFSSSLFDPCRGEESSLLMFPLCKVCRVICKMCSSRTCSMYIFYCMALNRRQ